MGNSASNKRASCRGLHSQCRLLPVAAAAWLLSLSPHLEALSSGHLQFHLISASLGPLLGHLSSQLGRQAQGSSSPLLARLALWFWISSPIQSQILSTALPKDSSQKKKRKKETTPGKQVHMRNPGCHTWLPDSGLGLSTLLSSKCVLWSPKLFFPRAVGGNFILLYLSYIY